MRVNIYYSCIHTQRRNDFQCVNWPGLNRFGSFDEPVGGRPSRYNRPIEREASPWTGREKMNVRNFRLESGGPRIETCSRIEAHLNFIHSVTA